MSDVTRRARYILSAEDQTKPALASVNRGIAGLTSALGTLGIGLSAAGFVAFAKQAGDAAMQLDRLENRFKAATGSFEAGRRELEFVRQVAGRLGLDLLSAADSYSGLTAAASGTSLAGQGVRDVFESVAQTSAILGLSSEQTQGALLALEQMMSKGTVQAEELRGQLGERIPGSFRIAAEAMNVTTAELGKMLEQGQVVASDFLPRFAEALRNNYQGEIPEHVKALGLMKTEFFNLSSALGKAGVQDTVVWGLETATEAMRAMRGGVDELAQAFRDFPEDSPLSRTLAAINFAAEGANQIIEFMRMGFGAHINDPDLARQSVPGLPAYLLRESSLGGADNLNPNMDRMPFAALPSAAVAGAASSPLGKAAKQPKAPKTDKSLLPGEEPLTTIGQAGAWESIAQKQIEDQNRSLAAQIEFDQQRFAGAIEAGNQMQDLWISQAAERAAAHQRGLDEEAWAEEQAARAKAQIWQGSAATFMSIGASLQAISGGQSRKMFEVSKAAGIAGTLIDTFRAAQGAYAALAPLGPAGPAMGIAAAAAATIAGMARVKAIQSTQFGGGGGAVSAGSDAAHGNFSGGGPPVTVNQPVNQPQGPQEISIRIIGGVTDAYIENEIIPRINGAASRNVKIEFARD